MPVFRQKPEEAATAAGGSDAPSFKDVLDIINPLQHLPIISDIYRKITGDEISPAARFIGASVYGGPIGGGLELASMAISDETGSSVTQKALNLVTQPHGHRSFEPARMAGNIPVWNGGASSDTQFRTMLAALSDGGDNIG